MTFSVVIPTLHEAVGLPGTLTALQAASEGESIEVVVVDGGSTDGTREVAARPGVRVIASDAGRAAQLSSGSSQTSGEVIMLLHADTWLPRGAFAEIRTALLDPNVVGGGFRKDFRDGRRALRRGGALRSAAFFRLTGWLFGDQAIFVRRLALDAAGGVPAQPLLEDVELCRRLRPLGRLVLLDATVTTSGRRFESRGVWGTWCLMAGVLAAYRVGVRPEVLAGWYRAGSGPPKSRAGRG